MKILQSKVLDMEITINEKKEKVRELENNITQIEKERNEDMQYISNFENMESALKHITVDLPQIAYQAAHGERSEIIQERIDELTKIANDSLQNFSVYIRP